MIKPLDGFELTIDRLHRNEAERMLKHPEFRDVDAFLFMYNRVAELENIIAKLNEVIAAHNEGKS